MNDPEVIIVTEGGAMYCGDCYFHDISDPYDRDYESYVATKQDQGTCERCLVEVSGGVVIAG